MDWTLRLKTVQSILVMSREQSARIASANKALTFRTVPPVFVLQAIQPDHNYTELPFSNRDEAILAAEHMVRAVKLCGGQASFTPVEDTPSRSLHSRSLPLLLQKLRQAKLVGAI